MVIFIILVVCFGVGIGGVFVWVVCCVLVVLVGLVIGIVVVVGGLGGYFLLLVMGVIYDLVDNDYMVGLLLLVVIVLVVCIYIVLYVWELVSEEVFR